MLAGSEVHLTVFPSFFCQKIHVLGLLRGFHVQKCNFSEHKSLKMGFSAFSRNKEAKFTWNPNVIFSSIFAKKSRFLVSKVKFLMRRTRFHRFCVRNKKNVTSIKLPKSHVHLVGIKRQMYFGSQLLFIFHQILPKNRGFWFPKSSF